ncbi:hypothetical protein GW950_00895 [Candidatus Wolfebacteria bacterium]|nr:hypothetical protein [Candidatus Wolfebacteria bacterium]
MDEVIKNFTKQFEYSPEIINGGNLKKYKKFIVVGMGGSNLAPDLIKLRNPKLDIYAHRNYGLPDWDKKVLKESLIILNSYSGNTEEVLESFKIVNKNKYPMVAVSTGGKLLKLAMKYKKPYIQMPDEGIQPRMALGFNMVAILKAMGETAMVNELKKLTISLKPHEIERVGKSLARKLRDHVPVIYSSKKNFPIAYNWKVKFNETAKIPAFTNKFPELNHNEMTGFDVVSKTAHLSNVFSFVFLKDMTDNPKISKRMNVTERLYRERRLPVEVAMLNGKSPFHKMFYSLLLADWTAYHTAKEYGVDPEAVPMVEDFKKLIK